VLVFYNDNKASFQQFVEMMRNERDRQYREDVQMLVLTAVDCRKATDKQQETNQNVLKLGTDIEKAVPTEDCSMREGVTTAEELEYEDNNDHNALRFVCLSNKLFFNVLYELFIANVIQKVVIIITTQYTIIWKIILAI